MTTYSDQVRALTKESDGQIFIPGHAFMFNVGTWTLTRGAAGNYFMRKTAAADTSNPAVNLTRELLKRIGADPSIAALAPVHDIRGFQIKKLQAVYAIATAALVAHTYDLLRTTYVNNVAPAVDATIGGVLTGALAIAAQAQPYVTPITVGTPFVLGNNTDLVTDWFELTVNAAATSVYDLYGLFVDFNLNLL